MPHIIVEYSDHLRANVPQLLHTLHFRLAEIETIKLEAIKTRAIPVQASITGDGTGSNDMIHITLKLLPGRDNALKKTMAQALWQATRDHVADERISVSAEVMELHAESYTK